MPVQTHRSSRRRSHSPAAEQSRHRRRRHSPSPQPHQGHTASSAPAVLPFQARPLQTRDFERYAAMFGLYLDIQKQLVLEDLEEKEVKGRWKRFIHRWNRGELAEGWYDPATLQKAQASAQDRNEPRPPLPTNTDPANGDNEDEEEGDETFGPALPSTSHSSTRRPHPQSGPSIPSLQDLALRNENLAASSLTARQDLHHARRADHLLQKSQLEDLVPRAAAGTKDRQLERKADTRLANNAFAASKTENVVEVPDADLMGDEEAGLDGYRKRRGEEERKKNERELRREELLRARRGEREERVREAREKEARTMEGLVALARARFG